MSGRGTMTLKEACEYTGLSERSMHRHLHARAFSATMPRGRRGGWMIFSESLRQWWSGRVGATSNARVMSR
jgi:excisionase family DNA binding protein